MSPTGGAATDNPTTPGGPWLPSTLCAAAFDTAVAPSPSAAATAPGRTSAIVPPFSVSALAAMLIPTVSASPGRTAYPNTSVSALLDADS